MTTTFESMLQHMAWADRKIGKALAEAENPPAEAVRWYAHIVTAEMNWLSRLTGGDSFVAPLFPEWDVATAVAQSEETLPKYEAFLACVDDFSRMVEYKNSAGEPFRTSVNDILTHVFLHGSYHRGQINARLRTAGLEPTPVDYIVFVRDRQ
ncbi:DinB family protein [Paenibacillus sp.]|uniref:DinB family protein n=1 Tax=Paenibacillus sp. TaxID=58172 RepID=UPI002D46F743|nr:DinB family protein [Paenibacillus sp.]HZG83342.1 DinB family protein [Paenibacillus sp.]